jgi:hypothetical protein
MSAIVRRAHCVIVQVPDLPHVHSILSCAQSTFDHPEWLFELKRVPILAPRDR